MPQAKLCSAKVANPMLKKVGMLFLCTTQDQFSNSVVGKLDPQLMSLLQEFADIMPKELLAHLPPQRAIDHCIPTILGSFPPSKAPYKLNAMQLQEL